MQPRLHRARLSLAAPRTRFHGEPSVACKALRRKAARLCRGQGGARRQLPPQPGTRSGLSVAVGPCLASNLTSSSLSRSSFATLARNWIRVFWS